MRNILVAATAAALLLSSGVAEAQEIKTYMWGVGLRLGTMVVPGNYPAILPPKITNYDFDEDGERDTNADGKELFSTIEKTGFDLSVGIQGVYYLDAKGRVNVMGGIAFGPASRFFDANLMVGYDRILTSSSSGFNVFAGGVIGGGTQNWRGQDDSEKLIVNYFPLRAHIGAMFNAAQFAGQVSLYGQMNIPASHKYTNLGGIEKEVGGTPFNYLNLGLELSFMYGDFTPPKPKKPSKGKKGKKGKKGGKGKK